MMLQRRMERAVERAAAMAALRRDRASGKRPRCRSARGEFGQLT